MTVERPLKTSITRRSLVRAAAWSVPVIAVAAATPMAAASTTPTPATMVITSTGSTEAGNARGIGVFGEPTQGRLVRVPYSFPEILEVTNGSIARTLDTVTAAISGPMSFSGSKYGSLAVTSVGPTTSAVTTQAAMVAGFGGTTSVTNVGIPLAPNQSQQLVVGFSWWGGAPSVGSSYSTAVNYTLTFDDNSTVSLSGNVNFVF